MNGAPAVTFGVMTESKLSTLNRTCALGPPCPKGETLKADGNHYRPIAFVAGGVAGAALVVGIITYVTGRSGSETLAGLGASPLPRGGAGLVASDSDPAARWLTLKRFT